MKKRFSIFKRVLCTCLMLCTCLTALPLSAAAADDAPNGTELVNHYNRRSPNAKIAVNPGDVVYVGPSICWSSTTFLKAHNGSSTINIAPGTAGVQKVDTFGYYDIYAYTVPEGVTSVSGCDDKRLYPYVYMITINQKLTKKNFNEYWEKENPQFLNACGQAFEPKTDLSLYGRSALFLGDSITHASRDDSTRYHSWAGRIGDLNNMDYVNAAVDGASISAVKALDKQFITQLNANKNRQFDYVIIWGGINDAWVGANLGTIGTQTNPDYINKTTFAGSLEYLFATMKEYFPDANYGYIINFPIVGNTEGNLQQWGEYAAIAIAACEKWGVSYLDLYHDTDFCTNSLQLGTTTCVIADGVHPNAKGYDVLYPKIEAWMDSLDPLPPAPPEPPLNPDNNDNNTTGNGTTNNEATDDPIQAPADTATTPTEEKGCGASISGMTAAFLTLFLAGAALLLFRKRRILE